MIPEPECYPNDAAWGAMNEHIRYVSNEGTTRLRIVQCGKLKVHSGRLVCSDPIVDMCIESKFIAVPPGEYEVVLSITDSSGRWSNGRTAYASLLLDRRATEVTRKCLRQQKGDDASPVVFPNPTVQVRSWKDCDHCGVDSATACFVDRESLRESIPGKAENIDWMSRLFGRPPHLPPLETPLPEPVGWLNERLPQSPDNNIIVFVSGWGDGCYPIVGGYDSAGNLVAVHIDFLMHQN